MRDNHSVDESPTGWNAFARANAAQRWRRQSAAMGRAMTEAIVEEAQVAAGMQVLDVACGTGEPAISLAARANSAAVTGIDISPAPLKIAAQRAAERGRTNVRFQQADAQQLPFLNESFDLLTCRLGVMFFADAGRAFGEMQRVLKPGGRAVLLAWGPMQQPYFETTIGTILRLLPELQLPASGAAMFKFAQQGALAEALRRAGFARAEDHQRTVPWHWPGTPEEVWSYFQEVTVPFKPLFERIPAERRAEVDAAVLHEIGLYYDGATVKFPAIIVLATARR